jgi:hypothetical protein
MPARCSSPRSGSRQRPIVAEVQGPRSQPGWPEVLSIAAAAVAVVLGAGLLTGLLPPEIQHIVFRTPFAIVVLIVGTGWLLWRISRRDPRSPER